jgi:Tfp pilus assembly protein FimT
MFENERIRRRQADSGRGRFAGNTQRHSVGVPGMGSMGKKNTYESCSAAGFSVLELLLIMSVILILSGMAIPAGRSAMKTYQLDAAADSAYGAIQAARYQAIMHGYLYQVDINSNNNQIQVSSEVPPAVTFSSVGSALPISGSQVTVGVGTASAGLAGHLILQFKANGSVSVTSGQTMPANLTIAYNGTTKHLTVSNYGAISTTSTTP